MEILTLIIMALAVGGIAFVIGRNSANGAGKSHTGQPPHHSNDGHSISNGCDGGAGGGDGGC